MAIKKSLLLAIGLGCWLGNSTVNAQDGKGTAKESSFYEFAGEHHEQSLKNESEEEDGDGPDALYHRWEQFTAARLGEDGKPVAPDILYKTLLKMPQPRFKSGDAPAWNYAGPMTTPTLGGGDGRINCIRIDPTNSNIIWAGTPGGGLWKSTDGGSSWSTNTDDLPTLSVSDLAINPKNTNIMYMATGDAYGTPTGNSNLGSGTYSLGLMKSVDGGQTWDTTSLNYTYTNTRLIYRVIVNPANPDIVLASTNGGIYRTTNAGKTWKLVLNQFVKDMQFNTSNPAEIYAGGNKLNISRDSGATWTESAFPGTWTNIYIGVTPANDSMIYAFAGYGQSTTMQPGSLYKSRNRGKTWSLVSSIDPNLTTFYIGYGMGIGVSPADTNLVVLCGVNLIRSTNGGKTWSKVGGYGYTVHPDIRNVVFYPGQGNALMVGTDGGIYRNTSYGSANGWTMVSSGIHALQLYRVGSSATDPNIALVGAQDNGVNRKNNTYWSHDVMGDGMECIVSYDDPKIMYSCIQYGDLRKSTNGGLGWNYMSTPAKGNWTAPLVLDPSNSNTLYYGGPSLYKSTDGGNSWTNISSGTSGIKTLGNLNRIVVADAGQTIYISQNNDWSTNTVKLNKTKDGGATWTSISRGLPVSTMSVSDITIDPQNSDRVWVTYTGYISGKKVFYSEDGGSTWTNISYNMPNVPVNCIAYDGSSKHGTYIGTDIGIFYRNDDQQYWNYYSYGLPKTIVSEIEVLPLLNKIRVATSGRGLWEANTIEPVLAVEKQKALEKAVTVYPNPGKGIFQLYMGEGVTRENVQLTILDLNGRTIRSFSAQQLSDAKYAVDLTGLSSGSYLATIKTAEGTVTKKLQVIE